MKIVNDKYLFDFSLGSLDEKESFFASHRQYHIISELTFYPAETLLKKYPHVIGAMSGIFNNNNKVELYLKSKPENWDDIKSQVDLTFHELSWLPLGFITPRIKAMIVNEAFYALDEEVASREDIDRAMVYGVNYPSGPFSWSKGQEKNYARLLIMLHRELNDERYAPHHLLLNYL